MGLDMYLMGEKFLWTNWEHPEKNLCEDGFRLEKKVLELGYWRKHPNLHGYIVQTFADGVDDCKPIELCVEDLYKILGAIKADALPSTSGFFFGESSAEKDESAKEILHKAIKWVEQKEEGVSRSVVYRASW